MQRPGFVAAVLGPLLAIALISGSWIRSSHSSAQATAAQPAVGALPDEAGRHRQKRETQATVRLGIHDYQEMDAGRFLRAHDHRPLLFRAACWIKMGTSEAVIRRRLAKAEANGGLGGGVFSGCGSTRRAWKYSSGPLAGDSARSASDLFGRGSAATPTVAAYTRWLRHLKRILGPHLRRWEVWNEPDVRAFYRGSPKDLVALTFAAARVLGRKKVIAASFSTGPYFEPDALSGTWEKGRQLTKAEVFHRYWTLLIRRANASGVPLPVSAASIHAHGRGPTASAAANVRRDVLRMFRGSLARVLKRHSIELWDSEWSLRGMAPNEINVFVGLRDTRNNATVWKQSAREGACLGYSRQIAYAWTRGSLIDDFIASTLQLNPRTPWAVSAFRDVNQQRVTCSRALTKTPSTRPQPRGRLPALQTVITKAPAGTVRRQGTRRTLQFRFRASPTDAVFRCKLERLRADAAPWRRCTSPTSYRVGSGRYRFTVKVKVAGKSDRSPASRVIRVRGASR